MVEVRRVTGLALFYQCFLVSAGAGQGASYPPGCEADAVRRLSVLEFWSGDLGAGAATCLEVDLEASDFVRGGVEIHSSFAISGLAVEVWPPATRSDLDARVRVRPYLGQDPVRIPISWRAEVAGPHYVVLRDFWSTSDGGAATASVWLESVEPEALVRARREALIWDPRVGWLLENAVPIRSIAPSDEDFEDLAPLREVLENVRVVLLGEATHGSGADLLAKTRLVKFLHQELGFDVLAIEAGMYEMALVRDSLRAGVAAPEAFRPGTWGMWLNAAEMQPLMRYVAASARTPRPLQTAGFDNQFMPAGAGIRFMDDLDRILTTWQLESDLLVEGTPERAALSSMTRMEFRRNQEPLPAAGVRRSLVEALNEAASGLAGVGQPEAGFWARLLRGAACHAERVWTEVSDAIALREACQRDRQMADHLTWLAREGFPDRKIIVWAATAHVMRTETMVPAAGPGASMGYHAREALEGEAYTIGISSYDGTFALPRAPTPQRIVADQHPLPEFEELMEAAGFVYGFLDLRGAVRDGSWPGGVFIARPDGHVAEARRWSDVLDGLLFVREQRRLTPVGER